MAVEQALAAACADMADTACRRRYVTEAVQLLRPHAEFEQRGVNSVALSVFCGIRSDGSLDLASIGHHWWRLPAAKPGRAPPRPTLCRASPAAPASDNPPRHLRSPFHRMNSPPPTPARPPGKRPLPAGLSPGRRAAAATCAHPKPPSPFAGAR